MKRGGGTKGLDDKSSGMEILIAEAFVKIKPTCPLILAKQGEHARIKNEESHLKCGLMCQLPLA